jgi:hypothetical protein
MNPKFVTQPVSDGIIGGRTAAHDSAGSEKADTQRPPSSPWGVFGGRRAAYFFSLAS